MRVINNYNVQEYKSNTIHFEHNAINKKLFSLINDNSTAQKVRTNTWGIFRNDVDKLNKTQKFQYYSDVFKAHINNFKEKASKLFPKNKEKLVL